MGKIDKSIEGFIYGELLELKPYLKLWSTLYDLDVKTVISILFIERQQYNLKDFRSALKRASCSICDYIDNHARPSGDKWVNIPTWVNNSRGYARIKYETAKRAYFLQRATRSPLTNEELQRYRTDPGTAIKVACIILHIHRNQWTNIAGPLSPGVLATLYNISDFTNKTPHSNPQTGGSILPAIIDGEYIEGLNFGDRVERVYNSNELKNFLKKTTAVTP